jgi:hypothetical protein
VEPATNNNHLQERLDLLLLRLRSAYDGIGHSSGRPYVYFIYAPRHERKIRRLVDEHLVSDSSLCFYHLDLLPLTIATLKGQEEKRQQLLDDPLKAGGTAAGVTRIWARSLNIEILEKLQTPPGSGRPVIVLRGLAALHPLGNPTALMEALAEREPRDPATGAIVPVVLLVPGLRPPQTSRRYLFLGLEKSRLDFYRGEEI